MTYRKNGLTDRHNPPKADKLLQGDYQIDVVHWSFMMFEGKDCVERLRRRKKLFLQKTERIKKIANLLITGNTKNQWQQVATKWQQTQKSAVFWPIFLRQKKAANPSYTRDCGVELVVRIELTTCSLRMSCSAIEPHQHRVFC